ncbi:hypothetical protein AB9N12_13165 [Bacteroides sp. AN502(2024)]|uniref:hypothetical protein n=1 Tax=Bacteroides sp. AN502(2024) TaxID=3160599 RepID=UPI0035141F89
MRNIYLIGGLLMCMAFTSCYEEDALTPTEGGIELRFKVPQGTNSWDNDIAQIHKDFGVYLIYKDLQDEDFNRSWTGTGGTSTSYKGEGCISDEMAQFYTEFMKKHIFAYLNNEKCKKITDYVLPMYWYMGYNVHVTVKFEVGGVVLFEQNNAMHEITNGLDYWSTCLFGPQAEMTDKYIIPEDEPTFSQRRKMILGNIIKIAIERKLIAIPEEFNRGLDYVTPISDNQDSPDYQLKRGFPGTVNTTTFSPNEGYDGSNPTQEAAFAGYVLLSLYYTKAESDVQYAQYPLITEKFTLVRNYMKDNYGIDLEAIAKGPDNWDIEPHPEIPGNNDEEGGDEGGGDDWSNW